MSGEWETPPEIFAPLHEEFHFTVDGAANPRNALLPDFYDDALLHKWRGRVWCNPPYGREIPLFLAQGWNSVFLWETAEVVVFLLPARTDTRWFHEYCYQKKGVTIRFLKGRIKFRFQGITGDPAPFPSMIVIFQRPS